MKIILTITFILVTFISNGQDTTYYSHDEHEVSSIKEADYYTIVQRDQIDTVKRSETTYFITGQIKKENNYSADNKLEGKWKEWYESGQLHRDVDYKEGGLNGNLLTYWETGKPKRIDTYEKNKLISGKCFDSDGTEIMHFDYEKMPEFPGGEIALIRYLSREIKYPATALRKEIQGQTIVNFIINTNGSVTDVHIIQSDNEVFNDESIRVVQSMPAWHPGMQDGEPVKVSYNLPIKYSMR